MRINDASNNFFVGTFQWVCYKAASEFLAYHPLLWNSIVSDSILFKALRFPVRAIDGFTAYLLSDIKFIMALEIH